MARAEAYLHAKFHLDPSNRLARIDQRHGETDRQTGQDRQRFDSTGRTVLQTVAQKRFAYAIGLLSCLSVTLVYCGQTVEWIKMPLGMEVGLDPGHTHCVRRPSSPRKRLNPQLSAHVSVAKRLDGSRFHLLYGGRPRERRHCVRWRPAPPHQKRNTDALPTFRPMSIVAKPLNESIFMPLIT